MEGIFRNGNQSLLFLQTKKTCPKTEIMFAEKQLEKRKKNQWKTKKFCAYIAVDWTTESCFSKK